MEKSGIKLSANVRGALWMAASALAFAAMIVTIRELSASMHTFEIVFFRNLVGTMYMLPWLYRVGFGALRTTQLPLLSLRSVFSFLGALTWFYAVTVMPIGEAVSIQFTMPIFTMLGAAVLLNERVRSHRWAAVGVAFAGVLIIMRPGVAAIDTPALIVLASAVFFAGATVLVKRFTGQLSPGAIVFYVNFLMLPMSTIAVLFVWTTPGWLDIPMILAFSAANMAAHICITRSLAVAEASAVMPFDFLRLPFAVVFGLVLYGEFPDRWTWAGAVVIFAATYYVGWREARAGGKRGASG